MISLRLDIKTISLRPVSFFKVRDWAKLNAVEMVRTYVKRSFSLC